MPAQSSTGRRNEYSDKEDTYLVKYIAKYNPQPEGRMGNKLYQRLVENAEGKWPWHKNHTWQSWRERYRSNKDYFDRRIAKQLRAAATEAKAKSGGSAASASPTPAAPARASAPQSPPSDKRERVPYTMEDDDNLAEYLAANSLSNRGRQGKNLYEAIADEPWGARHPWQSWHERYRKNYAYFDARIRRIYAGEHDDEGDDEDVPRPRTVDGATRYSLSQSRVHAKREKEKEKEREREQTKRRRESQGDEGREAPPRKKTCVEQPVPGPSQRREPQPEVVEVPEESEVAEVPEVPEEPEVEILDEPDVGGAHEGREDEGLPDGEEEQAVVHDEERDEEADAGDGGEEQDVEDEDELEDEDEDEDGDEQGPIGSDDYGGEIFDAPEPDEEVEGEDGSESESDRDQEEAELMLSDNQFADAQDMDEALGGDVDADADVGGDETVVEAGAVQLEVQNEDPEENTFDASPHDIPMADDDHNNEDDNEGEPHISTTPPSGASPPARTHNTRIEHDIDARPDTPELSPAEDADARRRREHGHEPAPARKHATRIRALRKRVRGEEDFFATPTPAMSAQNSPTARHVARREVEGEDGDGGDGPQKRERQREPPRLDEGAWNTAFSDARGRTRASPKRPRRSGVEPDFEFEEAEAREASEGEGEGAGEKEEAEAPPAQWPPVRGRAKGKAKVTEEAAAPTTPARGVRDKGKAREVVASPGEGRVVTTEHILSVKTIRTVERRPANGISGAAAGAGATVEAAREPAADQSSSPRTLVQEDEDEDRREEVKAERHPFSQVEPGESRGASTSRGMSVFPRVGGGAKDSRKEDIARMQKMLAASRRAMPPQEKDNKDKDNEKDKKRRARLGGLWRDESPESFLRRLATGGGPGRASELGVRTTHGMSPAGSAEDARRREQRLARFQEREESLPVPESVPPIASSPLARRGSNSTVGEIVPHASTSRAAQGAPKAGPPQRADKGKARAGAPPSGAQINAYGQSRRHTTNEPEADLNPAPREQSTVVRRSRHALRPSLAVIPSFPLGDDPYTALSHIFHPPPSGAGHARVYTLPSRPSPPAHPTSADPPMYASLPAHERAMVKAAGMQCMLAAMARNHGFGMEVVNEVCAEASSLEKTDRVLRDMRESANRQANVSLREMYSRSDDGEGEGEADEEDGAEAEEDDEEEPEDAEDAEEEVEAEEAEEDEPAEGADDVDEDLPDSSMEADDGDSAEVESVLGQDANGWLDDAPQAESSRIRGGEAEYGEGGMDIDVDVSRVASTSTSLRKPFRIKVLPKESAPGAVYSPPKKTRASRFIKKAQKAELELARSSQRGEDAMDVEADPFANVLMKPRYASLPAGSIGQLSRYGAEEWLEVERKYGPGAAKMMMGKALAKLLPAHPQ